MSHPVLNIAVKAARLAGNVILRYIDRLESITVESKGRNDFVSEVDRFAEMEIIRVINATYPDHAIVAEESGEHSGNAYRWIIDPLDGTTNFLHGFPHFSVSIALTHNEVLQQGVIFDPLKNEMFTASRGRGAQLNDRRIRVSETNKLRSALIGTGFPFRSLANLDPWLNTFRDMLIQTSGVRRAGSAALDLAYVACGRFDGFWESGLKIWDMAAGCLLIQEAGGLVTDFSNDQNHLHSGNIVCATPRIHPKILDIVSKHQRR